jgi:hypothetical protein
VKILLRLSDVFDFSRDRVSKEFLDSSIDYMNCESKFHYIMHYITGDYLLDKVYSENFTKLSGIIDKLSYVKRLANDRYVENVIIGINIQDDILTSPNVFDTNCMGNEMFFRSERLPENYMYSQEFDNDVINSSKKVLKNDIMYEIKDFDCSDVCDKNKCSFMCRLLSKKYIDMLRELHYLENYINNIVKKDSRTASLPVHFYVLFKIEDSNIKNKHLHNLLIDYFKQK